MQNIFRGPDYLLVADSDGEIKLEHQKAAHGGGERKISVSRAVLEYAEEKRPSLSELFKRFNLYHLDHD